MAGGKQKGCNGHDKWVLTSADLQLLNTYLGLWQSGTHKVEVLLPIIVRAWLRHQPGPMAGVDLSQPINEKNLSPKQLDHLRAKTIQIKNWYSKNVNSMSAGTGAYGDVLDVLKGSLKRTRSPSVVQIYCKWFAEEVQAATAAAWEVLVDKKGKGAGLRHNFDIQWVNQFLKKPTAGNVPAGLTAETVLERRAEIDFFIAHGHKMDEPIPEVKPIKNSEYQEAINIIEKNGGQELVNALAKVTGGVATILLAVPVPKFGGNVYQYEWSSVTKPSLRWACHYQEQPFNVGDAFGQWACDWHLRPELLITRSSLYPEGEQPAATEDANANYQPSKTTRKRQKTAPVPLPSADSDEASTGPIIVPRRRMTDLPMSVLAEDGTIKYQDVFNPSSDSNINNTLRHSAHANPSNSVNPGAAPMGPVYPAAPATTVISDSSINLGTLDFAGLSAASAVHDPLTVPTVSVQRALNTAVAGAALDQPAPSMLHQMAGGAASTVRYHREQSLRPFQSATQTPDGSYIYCEGLVYTMPDYDQATNPPAAKPQAAEPQDLLLPNTLHPRPSSSLSSRSSLTHSLNDDDLFSSPSNNFGLTMPDQAPFGDADFQSLYSELDMSMVDMGQDTLNPTTVMTGNTLSLDVASTPGLTLPPGGPPGINPSGMAPGVLPSSHTNLGHPISGAWPPTMAPSIANVRQPDRRLAMPQSTITELGRTYIHTPESAEYERIYWALLGRADVLPVPMREPWSNAINRWLEIEQERGYLPANASNDPKSSGDPTIVTQMRRSKAGILGGIEYQMKFSKKVLAEMDKGWDKWFAHLLHMGGGMMITAGGFGTMLTILILFLQWGRAADSASDIGKASWALSEFNMWLRQPQSLLGRPAPLPEKWISAPKASGTKRKRADQQDAPRRGKKMIPTRDAGASQGICDGDEDAEGETE